MAVNDNTNNYWQWWDQNNTAKPMQPTTYTTTTAGTWEWMTPATKQDLEALEAKVEALLKALNVQIAEVNKEDPDDCDACKELDEQCLYHEGENAGWHGALEILEGRIQAELKDLRDES